MSNHHKRPIFFLRDHPELCTLHVEMVRKMKEFDEARERLATLRDKARLDYWTRFENYVVDKGLLSRDVIDYYEQHHIHNGVFFISSQVDIKNKELDLIVSEELRIPQDLMEEEEVDD